MSKPFYYGLVIVIAVVAVASVGAGGYWLGHRAAAGDAAQGGLAPATSPVAKDQPATATVQTVPIVRKAITESIEAYGTVIAQPGEMRILSVPFEARVGHVLVTPGQPVDKGRSLIVIESSPDAQLQLREAQSALDAANAVLQNTQQRFAEKLATTQELAQARQAADSAKLRLESLQSRGVGPSRELKADFAGVIGKVDVQEGQIVPAGGPLVELIVENRIEVRLGVDPGEVARLRPAQPVKLQSVNSPTTQGIGGHIRLVTQTVNADTRLVEVFTSLDPGTKLMLSEYVRGELPGGTARGLVVPRAAIVSGDKGALTVFTVADGKAVAHTVTLGLQTDDEVEVTGDGLKEGQPVVIVGNAELEQDMPVVVEKSP